MVDFKHGQSGGSYSDEDSEMMTSDMLMNDTSDLGPGSHHDIEEPMDSSIVRPGDLGMTVTEGSRFGNFIQTLTGAIRLGASKVELQTNMAGGGEAVGAESYGEDTRQALRELAKVNEVELTSVHVPTQIGNVSGFDGREGFADDQRKRAIEEIKKAIDFASDVNGGGGITFHTGEFQRPMSESEWAIERNEDGSAKLDADGNKIYNFLAYEEEPGKAVSYMVDKRNGRIIGDVRKSNLIREPVYKTAEKDGWGQDVYGNKHFIKKGDLVSDEEKYIDPTDINQLFFRVAEWDPKNVNFKTKKLDWQEIEKRADEWNRNEEQKFQNDSSYKMDKKTTEEMAYRIQIENQILQAKGSSLFHGRGYEDERKEYEAISESLEYYKELESKIPQEEVWKIMQSDPKSRRFAGSGLVGSDQKKPSEILEKAKTDLLRSLQYIHEASASADAQAKTLQDQLDNVVSVGDYAKDKSAQSTAEAGIYAMSKTKNEKLDKDIFLTPENIFPEMGYGSHPRELMQFVVDGRKRMVDLLTKDQIKDPHGRIQLVEKDGEQKEEIIQVKNPYKIKGMSKAEAEDYAVRHIKANLDTQHLGMWSKHFQPKYLDEKGRMETEEEKNKRFDQWFMDEVKNLHDGDQKSGKLGKDIIGELHIVDGMHGGSHVHLPTGQGTLPVVDAVKYLKGKGFKGILMSEGHGEESWGPGRIMTKTWEAFDSPIHFSGYSGGGGMGGPVRFADIHNSYFQQKQSPYFVFGGYSPGNDWTLWSEVPLE